jgi:hypothetical protein
MGRGAGEGPGFGRGQDWEGVKTGKSHILLKLLFTRIFLYLETK